MMMATFTRLLVMRMVASVRSESSPSARICLSRSSLLSSSSFKSLGESEKKAISEPEAKPEKKSNMAASRPAKMAPMEGAMNVISLNIC